MKACNFDPPPPLCHAYVTIGSAPPLPTPYFKVCYAGFNLSENPKKKVVLVISQQMRVKMQFFFILNDFKSLGLFYFTVEHNFCVLYKYFANFVSLEKIAKIKCANIRHLLSIYKKKTYPSRK